MDQMTTHTQRNGFTFKQFHVAHDGCAMKVGTDAVLEQVPGEHSLPTVLFLDENGRVRFATSGYRDYTQLKTIVETLLKTPQAPSR